MAKFVKIIKIAKTLKHPFSCSPPLVQEAPSSLTRGEKKRPMERRTPPESHVDGSCEGYCVFSLLPIEAWRVLYIAVSTPSRKERAQITYIEMAVESEEPPESGVGGRVYLLMGYSLFREHVY